MDNGLSETFFGGGGSGKTMSPSSPTFQDERNMEPVFSGRGFIPPRNGWKWWRYHEMGDHEILDHLLNVQHYDRRETPPSQSKSISCSVFNSTIGNSLLFNAKLITFIRLARYTKSFLLNVLTNISKIPQPCPCEWRW